MLLRHGSGQNVQLMVDMVRRVRARAAPSWRARRLPVLDHRLRGPDPPAGRGGPESIAY
jgi:hypothetical protein